MARKTAKAPKRRAKAPAKKPRKAPARSRTAPVKAKTPGRKRAKAAMPKKKVAAPKPPTIAAQDTVSIRMYRGLLGDFFLVKHKAGDAIFKMLIDCGVLQCIGSPQSKPSTSRGKERIKAGVADLIQDTGGSIDLVVATHEHYDHLSGFILASDAFKSLKIGKVWMAWTEDREDALANSYRNKKNNALTALATLSGSSSLAATDAMQTVSNLLQFYGGPSAIQNGAMGVTKAAAGDKLAGNVSCEAVLEWLRKRAGAGNVSFLKPGQAVHWGVGDVFRAYVLGPPRNDAKLRQLDPSKGEQREVYLVDGAKMEKVIISAKDEKKNQLAASGEELHDIYLARGEDVETVSGLAAIHASRASKERLEDQPFAGLYWRSYRSLHGGNVELKGAKRAKHPIVKLYEATDPASARIDGDWLGSIEGLALKIDGDVNNTSLALALEVTGERVLLFPADAQVGNWLSWKDQTYPVDDTKDGPKITIDTLLARTVFYKVGHHASHNATLRERGLELMTDPRLCAMIPVVEKTAREQKTSSVPKGWAMPYKDLYERLEDKTSRRILRGDGDPTEEADQFKKNKSIFSLNYGPPVGAKDPLWAELTLEL